MPTALQGFMETKKREEEYKREKFDEQIKTIEDLSKMCFERIQRSIKRQVKEVETFSDF